MLMEHKRCAKNILTFIAIKIIHRPTSNLKHHATIFLFFNYHKTIGNLQPRLQTPCSKHLILMDMKMFLRDLSRPNHYWENCDQVGRKTSLKKNKYHQKLKLNQLICLQKLPKISESIDSKCLVNNYQKNYRWQRVQHLQSTLPPDLWQLLCHPLF